MNIEYIKYEENDRGYYAEVFVDGVKVYGIHHTPTHATLFQCNTKGAPYDMFRCNIQPELIVDDRLSKQAIHNIITEHKIRGL